MAAASCEDYLNNIIKKHEFTRPDKEDDRVRHIETLNSQTGPVFLTYRAKRRWMNWCKRKTAEKPDIDFTAQRWRAPHCLGIGEAIRAEIRLKSEFARMPFLYIADGHHRSAAAARVFQAGKGAGHSGYFLSVIFPHNQMQILPYNRVLKDLNGSHRRNCWKSWTACLSSQPTGKALPERASMNSVCISTANGTRCISGPQFAATSDPIEKLDVTLLQKYVLAPMFGIDDPRTSKRINFVGGIRGTGELEKLVNSGEYACAFSMFPTSIEDLMTIADAGGIMPPKSTWFEPKLRDAMFCHMI